MGIHLETYTSSTIIIIMAASIAMNAQVRRGNFRLSKRWVKFFLVQVANFCAMLTR